MVFIKFNYNLFQLVPFNCSTSNYVNDQISWVLEFRWSDSQDICNFNIYLTVTILLGTIIIVIIELWSDDEYDISDMTV